MLMSVFGASADSSNPSLTDTDDSFDADAARFSRQAAQLPDLGGTTTASDSDYARQLAEMAKSIASDNDNSSDTSIGHSAGLWAFDHFRDQLNKRLNQESQNLLSPYGHASVNLDVDLDGNFDGTSASLLSPLSENNRYLTYSEMVLSASMPGTTGSLGVGQRWDQGNWMFGYNAFLDHLFNRHLDRASIGSELWGNFLRLSANYYLPVSGWQQDSVTQMERMARGYDITSQGYLPFTGNSACRSVGNSIWEKILTPLIAAVPIGTLRHLPLA